MVGKLAAFALGYVLGDLAHVAYATKRDIEADGERFEPSAAISEVRRRISVLAMGEEWVEAREIREARDTWNALWSYWEEMFRSDLPREAAEAELSTDQFLAIWRAAALTPPPLISSITKKGEES